MRSPDDSGQIYTMEGITAALILLGVLLFIIEANSIVVPQTEKVLDMKATLIAGDALTNLDFNDATGWSTSNSLKYYVAKWDGRDTVTYASNVPDPDMLPLNDALKTMFPADMQYNVNFTYWNGTNPHESRVLINGEPGDNSVVETRMITLNQGDVQTPSFWSTDGKYPKVVEVKITAWYL